MASETMQESDERWFRGVDEDEDDYRETESCYHCHGVGWFHDCGEDTCCCLNPEVDYCYDCPECGGAGEL